MPLSAVPELLTKLLAHPDPTASGRRVACLSATCLCALLLNLDKGNPPHLLSSFPSPVNPSIATEPGRVRFTFRREPVVSGGQDSFNFNDTVITGAVFAEHDGLAELDVMGTAAADGELCRWRTNHHRDRCTAPSTAAAPDAHAATASRSGTSCAPPQPPTAPRFLVLIDPAHGGTDNGAAITPSLAEKDVVLALARRVQHELTTRGIAAGMLRNSDVTISLDQRAVSANAARPALYITLHAANTGRGVHVFTSMLPAMQPLAGGILALGHGAGGIP